MTIFKFLPIGIAFFLLVACSQDNGTQNIESLDSNPNDHYAVRHPRKYRLQYTYAAGSNNHIRSWYDENKNKLFFGIEKRKYIVNK